VREVLRPHEKQIRAAFIYGSVAKGTEAPGSDVDLFVIGDLPPSNMAIDLDKIMLDLRRRVSLTSYSIDEFVRMRAEENSFVTRVLAGPVIWLIGNRDTVDALRPLQSRKPRARKAATR
jgi:predicted nucleotidyltransferase